MVPPGTLLPSKTLALPTNRDFDFWQGRCHPCPFSPGKTQDLNSFPRLACSIAGSGGCCVFTAC